MKQVFTTKSFSPILDIKIAKVNGNKLVLAINDTKLFQFYSSRKEGNLGGLFNDYTSNPSMFNEHTITLDIQDERTRP